MRGILRYAFTLLTTTAAAFGLAPPAAAQGPSPVVSSFTTAVHGGPEADALALPRVVPPASHIVTVSATAVDLLAAPTVSPAWLATPNPAPPAKLTVIPSGLPNWAPAKPPVPVRMAAAPKLVPTPIAAARPTLLPLTASAPPIRSWPPAHLVRKDGQDHEIRGVAYFDVTPEPQAPAVVVALPANPR